MSCNTYCSEPLPEFVLNDCNETVASGGKNMVIFDCSSEAVQTNDFTTPTIQSDIANGFATVLKDLLISSDGGSPNAAGASYVAGKEPNTNSYTQTLTVMDQNISTVNDGAYEAVDATTGKELAALIVTTAGGHSELFLPISAFMATVTKPIADNVDDNIHYIMTITGKTKHKSKAIATPAVY